MKQKSDSTTQQSRRSFTKALTSILVATPIALAANSEGAIEHTFGFENEGNNAKREASKKGKRNSVKSHCEVDVPSDATAGFTHQPPIIIGGGSFRIDTPSGLTVPTGSAPYIYKLESAPYLGIEAVRVHTEWSDATLHSDKFIGYTRYDQLPRGCKLNIWLQRTKANPRQGWESGDIDLQTRPHIIITGGKSETIPPTIETTYELSPAREIYKNNYKGRHEHPGFGDGRLFRIGRWQIVRENGTQLYDYTGNSDDEYRIAVTFDHYHARKTKKARS